MTTPSIIALALVLAITGAGLYLLVRYVCEQRAIAARAQASKTRAEILGWKDEAERAACAEYPNNSWDCSRF